MRTKLLATMSEESSGAAPIVSGCEVNRGLNIPGVHIDNAAAGGDAMEHLYTLGHRRIGIVTGPMASALSRDRLQGAAAAAKTHDAERDLSVFNGDFTIESGQAAAEYLLGRRDPPTALFCFNDQMAIGAMNVARVRGRQVPRDLSIIGFDDTPIAAHIWPPLTTVRWPIATMAREAARKLVSGEERADDGQSLFLSTLIRRASVTPPGGR